MDEESVRKALHKIKKSKGSKTSGVVLEMLSASGDVHIEQITNLLNKINSESKVPGDWDTSVIVNCFKNKSNATERGNYRGLQLLEHMMKVFERVIEKKIRDFVNIDAMEFAFMPGKDTIDVIFIARQLQVRYLEKKKKLFVLPLWIWRKHLIGSPERWLSRL